MYYAEAKAMIDDRDYTIDLFRFRTKQERDEFAKNGDSWAIRRKDAEPRHKEQFRYWRQDKSKPIRYINLENR